MLLLDLHQNRPDPLIYDISSSLKVPVTRIGDFYKNRGEPGCGKRCAWNGGGYYGELFTCGETYPSGSTFYCSEDCYKAVGATTRVFLSYRWGDAAVADQVTTYCRGAGIDVLRDQRQIDVLGSIRSFMDVAADSRYFVAIIGEGYFLSRYCLYEFMQLCQSDLPIRTIPIFIGESRASGAQRRYEEHWRDAHRRLKAALASLDQRHVAYLDPELELLRQAPDAIGSFLKECRTRKLPGGDWWLSWNCRYLVGAITTTFQPDDSVASNWTYTNLTASGAGEDAPPLRPTWNAKQCYVHFHSQSQAALGAFDANTSIKVISATNETASPVPAAGVHLVLLDEPFLKSLQLCRRLMQLDGCPHVKLVPVFLDSTLTKPASEVPLLQWWTTRLAATDNAQPAERADIDDVLARLGPLLTRLRDLLSPTVPARVSTQSP